MHAGIGRESDGFFLEGGITQLLGGDLPALQRHPNRLGQHHLQALGPNALAPLHQTGGMDRTDMLQVVKPAEVLPAGILFSARHYRFI